MVKTIKEITIALNEAQKYEAWMKEIEADERAGVIKAWKQWNNRMEKEKKMLEEHESKVNFDKSFLASPEHHVAGIDEAGRGPLAGPVVTAAVILPKNCEKFIGINDSKQLTKKAREEFAAIIKEHALAYAIHFQSAAVIDELNIYEATKQSMKKSVEGLEICPDFCIVDAMTLPIDISQSSIIKGDAKSLSIAAASILAKNARDEYMEQLHEKYPVYGFDQNAGYGTKQHLEALEAYGFMEEHRKSFEPIKSMVEVKERVLI
ncbi:ribonuclease HII [Ureibacillus chungkukjangi]|uniref:Ribonuclease HII n=1 Tax=Ureibacillus chungkukjangi TaxID=1202712 RepID=A0A318U599_9BACL|nr:ribonuclease HII [Ureibacillus chungkukjangi]PYF07089.1 RNase HII [Ureibacillus chungkukjangi]